MIALGRDSDIQRIGRTNYERSGRIVLKKLQELKGRAFPPVRGAMFIDSENDNLAHSVRSAM
jgi:hypothetical protein